MATKSRARKEKINASSSFERENKVIKVICFCSNDFNETDCLPKMNTDLNCACESYNRKQVKINPLRFMVASMGGTQGKIAIIRSYNVEEKQLSKQRTMTPIARAFLLFLQFARKGGLRKPGEKYCYEVIGLKKCLNLKV